MKNKRIRSLVNGFRGLGSNLIKYERYNLKVIKMK